MVSQLGVSTCASQLLESQPFRLTQDLALFPEQGGTRSAATPWGQPPLNPGTRSPTTVDTRQTDIPVVAHPHSKSNLRSRAQTLAQFTDRGHRWGWGWGWGPHQAEMLPTQLLLQIQSPVPSGWPNQVEMVQVQVLLHLVPVHWKRGFLPH